MYWDKNIDISDIKLPKQVEKELKEMEDIYRSNGDPDEFDYIAERADIDVRTMIIDNWVSSEDGQRIRAKFGYRR